MELSTVNVIQIDGGIVVDMKSYFDSPEGNKAAEERFAFCAKEMGMKADHLEFALELGTFEIDNQSVILCHST